MLEPPPGNEALRARLLRLARQDRLHPCLIFEGPAGLGKRMSARWLAAAINCRTAADAEGPCGSCWSCRAIARGQHPDILEIGLDPEKATPVISVAQARALLAQLTLHPAQARHRLVILDPAHALNVEAANSLLKTLEEPPRATGFVLITDRPMDLLPTVRSRSQRVRFRPCPRAELVAWLRAEGLPAEEEVLAQAEGSPLRARALATGELAGRREAAERLLLAIEGGTAARLAWSEAHARGDRAEVSGEVEAALDLLASMLRDTLRLGLDPDAELINPDQRPRLRRWVLALQTRGLVLLDEALSEARLDLQAKVNPRLAMDALLARFAEQLAP